MHRKREVTDTAHFNGLEGSYHSIVMAGLPLCLQWTLPAKTVCEQQRQTLSLCEPSHSAPVRSTEH